MMLRLPMLSMLLVLLCASMATSFLAPVPYSLHNSPLQLRSSANAPRFVASLRRAPCSLRMSGPTPSLDNSDADAKDDEEEVPVTVLSDDDLDARIAEMGLGKEGGVEDKASGETVQLTPIERAQKEAAKIGSTAIGGVASAAITALNAIEQPIDEEEWQKQQGTKKPESKEDKPKTMMDAGVLGVVIPVILVGGGLGFWAIASENAWF